MDIKNSITHNINAKYNIVNVASGIGLRSIKDMINVAGTNNPQSSFLCTS
jgi:hypothetical protein